jgi:CheY-like chemotaxis protein
MLDSVAREAGLTVHTAEGGEEAVDFLRRARVDLVLLDLMMPAMDGFTTLSRIRALPGGKDVPVVVLSAKKLTPGERRRLQQQASQLVLKGNDLEERLRGILDSYFGFERKGG